MELEILKTASPLALALIVIWFIVKQFLVSLDKQREDFNKTIQNHLAHDMELHQDTIKTMNKLGDTIQSLENTQKENTRVMDNVLSFLQNHR